jgi:hypothetical protein
MKKYEQPTPARNGERTPLRHRPANLNDDHASNGKSSLRNDFPCKTTNEGRQECRTPQGRPNDSFFKENSYERSDARPAYGRTAQKASGKRDRYGQNNQEEPLTSFDDYPVIRGGQNSKDNELTDAKNYLREQERKYLKTDTMDRERDSLNWRQQRPER